MSLINNKLRKLKGLVFFVAICSVLIAVTRCSYEEEKEINTITVDDIGLLTMDYSDLKKIKGDGFYWNSNDANLIGIRFLKQNQDGNYTLEMTDYEAMELHIDISDLKRMRNDINIVNDSICKWSKDKNISIELPKPEDFIKSNSLLAESYPRLKSSNSEQGSQTITITTSGQDWGYNIFSLPQYTQVPLPVTCYAIGFLQAFNIKTETCGGEIIKGGVGIGGIWTTTISVNCTGSNCRFSFKTANSNGGSCTIKINVF